MTGTQSVTAPTNQANDLALCAARLDAIADDVARLRARYANVLTQSDHESLEFAMDHLRAVVVALFEKARQ